MKQTCDDLFDSFLAAIRDPTPDFFLMHQHQKQLDGFKLTPKEFHDLTVGTVEFLRELEERVHKHAARFLEKYRGRPLNHGEQEVISAVLDDTTCFYDAVFAEWRKEFENE